jgi:magnesium transporter
MNPPSDWRAEASTGNPCSANHPAAASCSAAIDERCTALLSLHASLVSKHLAVVSRRLAAVATIFLPISYLAGFWGQSFDLLTGSIERGWPAFLVPGVGLSAACVMAAVVMLPRRNWN